MCVKGRLRSDRTLHNAPFFAVCLACVVRIACDWCLGRGYVRRARLRSLVVGCLSLANLCGNGLSQAPVGWVWEIKDCVLLGCLFLR